MNIGLYFGSFNPIHHGHLIVASHMLYNAGLDQIWFVVSPQNPLKPNHSLLNEYHRLHLVRLATEGFTGFKVTDIEFKLPRPSYTVDTLAFLEERYPEEVFSIIMGSDSFQNLDKWKNPHIIRDRYPVKIYPRPGHIISIEGAGKNISLIDAPLLEISSSQIRKKVKAHQSIRYYVPDNVMEEIEKGRYYK